MKSNQTVALVASGIDALPFVLEKRGDTWVLDWSLKGGSGCRPASEPEIAMWQVLAELDAATVG
jgi:hypothetical protein